MSIASSRDERRRRLRESITIQPQENGIAALDSNPNANSNLPRRRKWDRLDAPPVLVPVGTAAIVGMKTVPLGETVDIANLAPTPQAVDPASNVNTNQIRKRWGAPSKEKLKFMPVGTSVLSAVATQDISIATSIDGTQDVCADAGNQAVDESLQNAGEATAEDAGGTADSVSTPGGNNVDEGESKSKEAEDIAGSASNGNTKVGDESEIVQDQEDDDYADMLCTMRSLFPEGASAQDEGSLDTTADMQSPEDVTETQIDEPGIVVVSNNTPMTNASANEDSIASTGDCATTVKPANPEDTGLAGGVTPSHDTTGSMDTATVKEVPSTNTVVACQAKPCFDEKADENAGIFNNGSQANDQIDDDSAPSAPGNTSVFLVDDESDSDQEDSYFEDDSEADDILLDDDDEEEVDNMNVDPDLLRMSPVRALQASPIRSMASDNEDDDDDEAAEMYDTMRRILANSTPEKQEQLIRAAPEMAKDTLLKSGPVKGLRLKGKSIKSLTVVAEHEYRCVHIVMRS